MAKAETHRLFFALWPDEEVADALHAVGREAHGACGGRLTRRETLHLTLAFLGEVAAPRVAAAAGAAAAVLAAPFAWTLDRLGYWKHNRILWAGGESAELEALAAALTARLGEAGFALEKRPFAAHVTLLRNARCATAPALAEPVPWRAREFVLVESSPAEAGSRYGIVGRWPLSGRLD